jgi:hypothetical protein
MSQIALSPNPAGTGTFTIAAPDTNTDRTLTLPDNTGTVLTSASNITAQAMNGPAFSAYNSNNQTLSNSTWTKVVANIEVFDTNGNYDNTTNYRFTPTVAGYYQINAGVRIVASTSILLTVVGVFKNGVINSESVTPPFATSFSSANVSSVVFLNGSTDYIELFAFSTGTGTITLETNASQTYISGALVRAA